MLLVAHSKRVREPCVRIWESPGGRTCITSLCTKGFKYTYARAVSMGCITATAAAALIRLTRKCQSECMGNRGRRNAVIGKAPHLHTPEIAPKTGDPGVSQWFVTNHSLTRLCTVRLTDEPNISRVTLAPTPR